MDVGHIIDEATQVDEPDNAIQCEILILLSGNRARL